MQPKDLLGYLEAGDKTMEDLKKSNHVSFGPTYSWHSGTIDVATTSTQMARPGLIDAIFGQDRQLAYAQKAAQYRWAQYQLQNTYHQLSNQNR